MPSTRAQRRGQDPRILNVFRCIACWSPLYPGVPPAIPRSASLALLLGRLLLAPIPGRARLDERRGRGRAVVIRAGRLDQLIRYRCPLTTRSSWRTVLWRRLVDRVGDPLGERLTTAGTTSLAPTRGRRVDRPRHLRHHAGRPGIVSAATRRRLPVRLRGRQVAVPPSRRAPPRDYVGAHLGELPLGEVRMPVVQRVRHRQLEHAVAEELEPLVRRSTLARPRRVREHGLRQLRRERVDQLDEATGAK